MVATEAQDCMTREAENTSCLPLTNPGTAQPGSLGSSQGCDQGVGHGCGHLTLAWGGTSLPLWLQANIHPRPLPRGPLHRAAHSLASGFVGARTPRHSF